MLKPSHRKDLPNRSKKSYLLKGGLKVILEKLYSLRKRGKFTDLFRGRDRKRIHSFPNGVTAEEIEKYVLEYEADLQKKIKKMKLREYCELPMSFCVIADYNCNDCKIPHKDEVLKRKREGKKVMKPKRKKKNLIKATEERNALQEERNSKNKKISHRQPFTRAWK